MTHAKCMRYRQNTLSFSLSLSPSLSKFCAFPCYVLSGLSLPCLLAFSLDLDPFLNFSSILSLFFLSLVAPALHSFGDTLSLSLAVDEETFVFFPWKKKTRKSPYSALRMLQPLEGLTLENS
jgi:hypothetical protein